VKESDQNISSPSTPHFSANLPSLIQGRTPQVIKKRKPNEFLLVAKAISDLKGISFASKREDEFHTFRMNIACKLKQLPLAGALRTQIKIQSHNGGEDCSLDQPVNAFPSDV
jgi:hypothetical protein